MTTNHANDATSRKPLRLWPGVVAAALIVLLSFVGPLIVPGAALVGILGGMVGGLAVVVWWVFFSRAPWSERLGAIVLMVVALLATSRVVHESIANGMMGMMLPFYTMGGTGIVNALDADDGVLLWSRNAAADTGKAVPDWGVASSPLVIDDLVIVAVAGELVAYDVATGSPRWFGPEGGGGYSSPHLVTIDQAPQIVLLRGGRTISVAPADGTLLWDHTWQPGVSIVQPAVTVGGDVLIAAGDGMAGAGIRRLAVARGPEGWTVEERWTSRGLKPYFNDFVVHKGHAFGFDGSILASIDLADGTRTWKGGRYGHGQLVLLPDQDVLLVLSEQGELALVKAAPDQFTELARFPAIEGKTWNHPVLVGDVLLVRNGEEMAAFRLSLVD
ncbi:MAG: PQQ-binding-like beta-propeller repeat protein [Acidobacteria bacterium]|nr:PQQ-binding-like beta-propeller repeat protein [Acidobacteriota bacterium]